MKVRILSIFVLFFGFLGASVSVAQDVPTGTMKGEVVDTITGRPVTQGVARLVGRQGVETTVPLSATGLFTLSDVPEGIYQIRVEAEGYVTAIETDVLSVKDRVFEIAFRLSKAYGRVNEIVVTAQARNEDPFADSSSRTLSREEIRRNPGTAGDVFRGLDTLPGVAATGEFSNFSVRARDPRDNLILVDNIPFDKVVHFERSIGDEEQIAGGGRFSVFAPNLIGGADYQPSGWSSAYSGKNASLLRLRLAEGNRDTPSFNLRADIAGGEITYDGPSGFADNTSLLISARHYNFGRLFDLIDEKDNGTPKLTDFIFKSSTKINANNKLNILALFTPEEFDRDVDDIAESEDFDEASLIDTEQDSALFGVTLESLVGESGQLTNTVYYRTSDKTSIQGEAFPDLVGPDPEPSDIPVNEDILRLLEEETEIGWRLDYTTQTKWGALSAGARVTHTELDFARSVRTDFIRYTYDQEDFRADPNQQYIVLSPGRYNRTFQRDATDYSAYMDHAFVWGDYTFRPGIRFDRDDLTDESLISPRFTLGWQVTDDTKLTLTGGVFYQRPDYLEFAFDPNNDLENEKSTQVNLGVVHAVSDTVTATGEIYYHKLDDLVVLTDTTNGAANNNAEGYVAGIDIGLNKRLSDNWSGSINYSFSDAEMDENDGRGAFDADYHRPHIFGTGVTWRINDRWSLGAKWKYYSGRPADSFVIHSDVLNDPSLLRFSKESVGQNDINVDDFHSLNLRVDYRRRIGSANVIAFLDVINAYGRDNLDRIRFNERRGTIIDDGLGVFPQIGLRIEF